MTNRLSVKDDSGPDDGNKTVLLSDNILPTEDSNDPNGEPIFNTHFRSYQLPAKTPSFTQTDYKFDIRSKIWKLWKNYIIHVAHTTGTINILEGREQMPEVKGDSLFFEMELEKRRRWRGMNAFLWWTIQGSIQNLELREALYERYPVSQMLRTLIDLVTVDGKPATYGEFFLKHNEDSSSEEYSDSSSDDSSDENYREVRKGLLTKKKDVKEEIASAEKRLRKLEKEIAKNEARRQKAEKKKKAGAKTKDRAKMKAKAKTTAEAKKTSASKKKCAEKKEPSSGESSSSSEACSSGEESSSDE